MIGRLILSGEPDHRILALLADPILRSLVANDGNAARERALLASQWRLLGAVPAMSPAEALAKVPAEFRRLGPPDSVLLGRPKVVP